MKNISIKQLRCKQMYNKFTSKSGIPGPSAARFTRILLDKGLIRVMEEASGRKPAIYAFEPLLKLVRV